MKIIRFITIAAVLGAFAASAHAEDTAPAPETAEPRSKLPDSEALDLSKAASQMQTADPTGWVGIRVAPLPEALATQLGLGEDVGVLVLNVIRNGPADKAGLQRYDVLVKREGKLIAADAAAFIADVVDRKPGSTLTLRVIRQSKQKTIPVIVGKPRTFNEVRYKYAPLEPTQQRQREVGGLQAQVLRRVDNNWVLEKDPNRVNRALSNLRTQDFATNSDRQSGSATAGENTALKRALPSEAVTWNNSRDVRVTVARTEDGLVVTKKPENRDANAQVDRYASEVDFKNSDRATYRYYNEYANQQRAASRVLDEQLALAEMQAPKGDRATEEAKRLGDPTPARRPKPESDLKDEHPADAEADLERDTFSQDGKGVRPVAEPKPGQESHRGIAAGGKAAASAPDDVAARSRTRTGIAPPEDSGRHEEKKDLDPVGEAPPEVTCHTLNGDELLAFAKKLSADEERKVVVISDGNHSTLLVGEHLRKNPKLKSAPAKSGRTPPSGKPDTDTRLSERAAKAEDAEGDADDAVDGKLRKQNGQAVTSAHLLAELRAIHKAVTAASRPAIEYVVGRDGQITVTVRGADSMVKMEYAGREDLAKRNPDLLKRFDRVMRKAQTAEE